MSALAARQRHAVPDIPAEHAEDTSRGEAWRISTAAGTARRARTSKVIDAEEEVERERGGLYRSKSRREGNRREERARGGGAGVARRGNRRRPFILRKPTVYSPGNTQGDLVSCKEP